MRIEKYTRKELLKDWSDVSGFTLNDLTQALTALEVVLRRAILEGKEISLNGIGTFSYSHRKHVPPRPNAHYDFKTGERIPSKEVPSHFAPLFKYSKTLAKELKEISAYS